LTNLSTKYIDSPAQGNQRFLQIRKVTLVGAFVNIVLAVAKIVLGVVGQSQALVADGVHSLADLVSDAVVLWAAKHSAAEADERHPYGHGRIETVITVGLGVFLIVVATGIMIDAIGRLLHPETLAHPSWITLVVAFISIFSKEWLYHYTLRVAKQLRSNLLTANAWHHRTDAISSVVAFIGIAGAIAGFEILDAIAAAGVSLMIAKVGWDIGWQSLQELIDTALDTERVATIRQTIMGIHGVKQLHSLRTRRMGGYAFMDVHVIVDSHISVSEGHQIGEIVKKKIKKEIDEVIDVTVHIDPEDDEEKASCEGLPLRDEIMRRLQQYWGNHTASKSIKRVTLHYLDNKIFVELLLPIELAQSQDVSSKLIDDFKSFAQRDEQIASIQVCFG